MASTPVQSTVPNTTTNTTTAMMSPTTVMTVMSSGHVQAPVTPNGSPSNTSSSSGGVVLIAKFDYSAKEPHELDLKKGERLFLIDNSKQWWLVRRLDAGCEQTG